MSFPTKAERTACYNVRDRYWECLDENHLTVEQSGPCEALRKLYVAGCPGQWVKHFDRKYSYLKFKDRIERDGYEPLNQGSQNT